ncbi:MAG: GNAT family N-acetyltransferase [Desulfobacterales bacterium]|nr:GNAT family N-acetyltransferase [Desulfobacterales bacterium]
MIRVAEQKDIDDMVLLLKELFEIEKDFTFNKKKHETGLKKVIDEKDRSHLFVYEKNNDVIGMCSVQLLISSVEGSFSAVIEDVVVSKNHIGNGIGKELISASEKWALKKGATRITLLADKNNVKALGFYERLDFEQTDMFCLRKYLK